MASTYSTWDYYSIEYNGKLTQGEYTAYAMTACAEINLRTFGNAEHAPESMKNNLCICECELVDAFALFDSSYTYLPKGISSINNDGFSAATSYGSSKTDSRETAQSNDIKRICSRYLLRPINLLYPGARIC